MRRTLLALLCCGALSACVGRGALDSECGNFARHPLPRSQLVKDIQSGASMIDPLDAGRPAVDAAADAGGSASPFLPADATAAGDPLTTSIRALVEGDAGPGLTASGRGEPGALLLLSGGGQWGAFGAGFLSSLNDRGKLPRFETITGVSTGGLQSLFLGTLGDPTLDAVERGKVFRELMRRYRPADESEIVDRDSRKELAILTGSFAGLRPLQKRIHAALCDRVTAPSACPVIQRLARSETSVFIGYVHAADGRFYYSHINKIAKYAYPDAQNNEVPASPEALAEAQRCIAGAALASAAMPLFFQQVRVGPRAAQETYYDGGVRQSVFEARIAALLQQEVESAREAREARGLAPSEEPKVFVVRNGPTTLEPEADADKERNAIDAAMRAEQIVVNQLEVQSIADLRLARPQGHIVLITADGFGKRHLQPGDDPELADVPHYAGPGEEEGCTKQPQDAMFSPSFMACIMRYGRQRALRDEPWITLSKLPLAAPPPPGAAERGQ